MTRIKICGITNLEDALFAARQGADYLGFIFYPGSARYIKTEEAAGIVLEVKGLMGAGSPEFVGVFVDAFVQDVNQVREQVGLSLVQLHGSEAPRDLSDLGPGAFKALRPETLEAARESAERYSTAMLADADRPQLLLDSYHPTEKGGTGQLAEGAIAAWMSAHYRLLLAGGLDPLNVAGIIQDVHPWGVDVSSGVELVMDGRLVKGRKDPNKVQAFIRAVRSATVRST